MFLCSFFLTPPQCNPRQALLQPQRLHFKHCLAQQENAATLSFFVGSDRQNSNTLIRMLIVH